MSRRFRVWFAVIVVVFAISNFRGERVCAVPVEEVEVSEPEMINLIDYWAEHPEESPYELSRNARATAMVVDATCAVICKAYGVTPGEECRLAVAQCVINRTKSTGFPDTLVEVCEQPMQWEGVTSDSVGSNETAALMKKVLNGEINSSLPSSCVFFRLTAEGIEFRNAWEISVADIFLVKY